jgi:tetratricopeptide (TPR) repeat protein
VAGLLDYDAIALFVQHARAANPRFALRADNAAAVVAICRALDGLPLALELAAARLRHFAPQVLLERLDARLAELVGGPRDMPARQQTLRATIAWSYDLLDAGEQRLLRRLAVFVGGCTAVAAEAVCGGDGSLNILAGLESLGAKSLVQAQAGPAGEPRFQLLEMVREFAAEQLRASGEAPALAERHLHFFQALAVELYAHPEMGTALARLDADHNNLRAAIDWALAQPDPETRAVGARLTGALGGFWFFRGYVTEGWERLTAALPHAGGNLRVVARIHEGMGDFARLRKDYAAAHDHLTTSIAAFRVLDDEGAIVDIVHSLGMLACDRSDYDAARRYFEESRALARKLGYPDDPMSLMNLGEVLKVQGHHDQALPLFQAALDRAREDGQPRSIAHALWSLGCAASDAGDHALAGARLREALALFGESGIKMHVAGTLEGLARMMLRAPGALDDAATVAWAARLWGAAEALRERIAVPLAADTLTLYQEAVTEARRHLEAATWEQAWAEGRAMSMEEAIAHAMLEPNPV